MDPLKSKLGAADPQDASHSKYIRNLRSTDQLMKQFCKVESSVDKKSYDRGYVHAFEFDDEQRLRVVKLMAGGLLFEDAFDLVWSQISADP